MNRICRYDMNRYILRYGDGYFLDSLLENDAICVVNPRRYKKPQGFTMKKVNFCFEKPQLDDMLGFCKSLNISFSSLAGYIIRGVMISDDKNFDDLEDYIMPFGKIINFVTGKPVNKVRRITEIRVPYVDENMVEEMLFEKPEIKRLIKEKRSKSAVLSALISHWYAKQIWGITSYINMAFYLDFKVYMYAHPEMRDKGLNRYILQHKNTFDTEIRKRTEPTIKALISRALNNNK